MKIQRLGSNTYHFIKDIRIAVLVLGTAILFYACKNNEIDKIKAFHSPENLPVLEANNFETIQTDSGQVRFSMKTPQLLRFEDDGKFYHEFPQGVQLIKYDAQKNIISSVSADYAKEFIKEGKWEAKNNVVVLNEKGDSLKTEHLILEEKNEKIHTEEFVKIISDSRIITGIGLTSDLNMLNWKIKNPKGTIYVDVNNKTPNTGSIKNEEKPIEPVKTQQPAQQAIKFK